MRIEILTAPHCPHDEPTLALVRDVATALAPEAKVRHIQLETPPDGSPASPTVRVDGDAVALETDASIPPRWLLEAAILRALQPRGVLFLCVANSARSQMAEGIARALAPADTQIFSAGSQPSRVNPFATRALAELDIDATEHHSKPIDAIPRDDVDTVITLCAEEVCPTWLGHARRVHWGLPDPAPAPGAPDQTEAQTLTAFRQVRDELHHRLTALFRPTT